MCKATITRVMRDNSGEGEKFYSYIILVHYSFVFFSYLLSGYLCPNVDRLGLQGVHATKAWRYGTVILDKYGIGV